MVRRRSLPGWLALSLAAASVLFLAALATAQPPATALPTRDQAAPPSATEPTGTGRVTVLVVAADNGLPVKRVRLMLQGFVLPPRPPTVPPPFASAANAPGSEPGQVPMRFEQPARVRREAETDDKGRAEFATLPAASFSLSASSLPAGFARMPMSEPFSLGNGESRSLTIRLNRTGAITGRVLDQAGDPLPRVTVRALHKDSGEGFRRLAVAGAFVTTDDRGQFRVYDLPAGDYFVSALAPPQFTSLPPVATQRLSVGYVVTFFPGVPTLEGAQPVTVAAAQDTPGVEFSLLQGRLGRITGVVLDSAGNPVSGPSVGMSLSPRRPEYGQAWRGASAAVDGSFAIENVPPGAYYLSATDARGQPAGGERAEAAVVPVTTNGDEVVVNMRTNRGAVLSGRLVLEGAPGSASGGAVSPVIASARVMAQAVAPGGATPPGWSLAPSGGVLEDGTFHLTGVRGKVVFVVTGTPARLKAVRRGASDLLGAPLELEGTERIDGIEVVLTTEFGSVTGIVSDARGRPAAGSHVLVFPEDSRLWSAPFVSVGRTMTAAPVAAPASVPGTVARPLPAGRFTVGRVVPGRYLAIALPGGDTGSFVAVPDADRLAELAPRAMPVTVRVGEATTVALTIQ